MNIKTLVVGPLEENCYILEKDNSCIVIDPGAEFERIASNINSPLLGVIITHYHDDHIGALSQLVNKYNCPVYSHNNLKEGDFSIGTFNFEVIFTPGHKEDAITLYFPQDKVMFTGDFIFNGSIGRMDLAGGNSQDMIDSIKKILTYPRDIKIYPGHFLPTTLKDEEVNLNYFMNRI